MTNTPRKRAPGGGRKPKPPGEKRIKVAITMRPDLYEQTKGNRSHLVEVSLEYYLTLLSNVSVFHAPKSDTTTVTIKTGNEPQSEYRFTYGVKGFTED